MAHLSQLFDDLERDALLDVDFGVNIAGLCFRLDFGVRQAGGDTEPRGVKGGLDGHSSEHVEKNLEGYDEEREKFPGGKDQSDLKEKGDCLVSDQMGTN